MGGLLIRAVLVFCVLLNNLQGERQLLQILPIKPSVHRLKVEARNDGEAESVENDSFLSPLVPISFEIS